MILVIAQLVFAVVMASLACKAGWKLCDWIERSK